VSKIIESLRADMAALYEIGAIDKVTMREFDAVCPPPVREFSAKMPETISLVTTVKPMKR
jgi:putative transcriptional regulator